MTVSADTLKGFPLLAGLPEDPLETIASMPRLEDYPESALVFSEGSPAQHFYLVLSGKVSLEKRVQLGKTGTTRRATIDVVGLGQPTAWSSAFARSGRAPCGTDTEDREKRPAAYFCCRQERTG